MDSETSNNPGPVSFGGESTLEPQLRALQQLQVAFLVSLVMSIVGGSAQAFMMERVLSRGISYGEISAAMSWVFGAWRVVSLVIAVVTLIALNTLSKSPAEARASGLARGAFIVSLVALIYEVVSGLAQQALVASLSSHQLSSFYVAMGGFQSALDLCADVMLLEVLLRLRRFGAPDSREVAESEGLVRAGLIGAMVARILMGYASHMIGALLFRSSGGSQWGSFLMRLPFSLLVSGGFLWLIGMTAKALREMPSAEQRSQAAVAGAPAAPGEQAEAQAQADAGGRNMLYGALWAIGGLALTGFSYMSATGSPSGGRYIVAYGAIVGGIVQFIRGLAQSSGRK